MNGGAKYLACSAMLVVAACAGQSGKLEVRPTSTALAAGKKPVSFRVAEGHQQLAMNNVALALESYRRALREDPTSVDAHAGVAASYDRMGRYDLARRSYEAALAVEPGNTTILAMLAASLDQQGKTAAATGVRAEIRQRLAELPAPAATASVDNPPVAPPPGSEVVAPAAELAASIGAPSSARDLSASLPDLTSTPLAVSLGAIAPVAVVAAFAPDAPQPRAAQVAASEPVEQPPLAVTEVSLPARSVTIKLPAPRPVEAAKPSAAPVASVPDSPPVQMAEAVRPPEIPSREPARPQPAIPNGVPHLALPAAGKVRPPAALPVATGNGPRLERTSLGEVALITTGGPQWASMVVKQDRRSATVRFVPLKEANARFASVRLLNAARVQGLAARTRSTLFGRGWRGMAIGDAKATRSRSVVLYPAHRRTTALSLARQFGFDAAQRANGKEITVLLGRDAATLVKRSPAG